MSLPSLAGSISLTSGKCESTRKVNKMSQNWQAELEDFANCSVGQKEQGRHEGGNPHHDNGCRHFQDGRDFYGPLHVMNWMRSDHSFDSDAYAAACKRLGIGLGGDSFYGERAEFLGKTFRKRP